MIAFRDFVPQTLARHLMGIVKEYESIQEVVTRVNRWIEQEGVEVLNVETLIVTSLPSSEFHDLKVRMETPDSANAMFQIVRVWYRQHGRHDAAYIGVTQRLSEPIADSP